MKYMQVLVDAECTHDGSIKHIQKFEFWGWKTLDRRVLDAERTDNLLQLQVPFSLILAWLVGTWSRHPVNYILHPIDILVCACYEVSVPSLWNWCCIYSADSLINFICMQLNLLSNGFRLLKTGGSLVYSTCRWVISSTISATVDVSIPSWKYSLTFFGNLGTYL